MDLLKKLVVFLVYCLERLNDLIHTAHLSFIEDCFEELFVLLELKNLVLLLHVLSIPEILAVVVSVESRVRGFLEVYFLLEQVVIVRHRRPHS